MYEVGNCCFIHRACLLPIQPLVWKRQYRAYGRIAGTTFRAGGKNQTLTLRNQFLAAEVDDLANGQEAISENCPCGIGLRPRRRNLLPFYRTQPLIALMGIKGRLKKRYS